MLSHKISSKQIQSNKQNYDIKIYHCLQKEKENIKLIESIGGIILRRFIKQNMHYSKKQKYISGIWNKGGNLQQIW